MKLGSAGYVIAGPDVPLAGTPHAAAKSRVSLSVLLGTVSVSMGDLDE